jgi:hypothetical protein
MRVFYIVCLASLLVFSSCVQDAKSIEKGDSHAARKVLIAAVQSDFKQKVVERVMEALVTDGYYVKVVGLDELEKTDTAPYGAVLAVGNLMAARLDRRLVSFARQHPGDPKLIVFYTQGPDAAVPAGIKADLKVDAIASPSWKDRIVPKADELAALIRKRFQ